MAALNIPTGWREKYSAELDYNIKQYEDLNKEVEVRTRLLTEEEKEKIFGSNPEYGKEIQI